MFFSYHNTFFVFDDFLIYLCHEPGHKASEPLRAVRSIVLPDLHTVSRRVVRMKTRRSLAALLRAVERAGADDSRARVHFELAVFHDNNGREAEAVPQYEAAIGLGLDKRRNAEALAWLASSLYKTGRPHDAMRRLTQARAVALDAKLGRFLDGLERRIRRVLTDRLVLAVYWLPGIFL